MFLYFFVELFYQVLKYQHRALLLTGIQTVIALGSLTITMTLLLYFDFGLMSTLIGQLAGMSAATCIGMYLYRQENFSESLHYKLQTETIVHYLKQSTPFIPGILASWIIASSDRLMLAHYAGLHEVGIYAIADMFGSVFRLLILQSWSGSYLPYILSAYQTNKENIHSVEQKNNTIMWITLASLMFLMFFCFWLAKPLFLIILPPAYHEALHYALIILTGHVFLLGSYFAASFIQYHKKTYFLAASFCIPAALNIILNTLLIPRYKIYGATGATLVSYAIYFGIMLWYNYRLRRVPK